VSLHSVWERDLGATVEHVDPDGGRVYATVDGGDALLALDAATGGTAWRLPTPGGSVVVATDPHDGTTYVSVADATMEPHSGHTVVRGTTLLLAVTDDGGERWTRSLPDPPASLDVADATAARAGTVETAATADTLYLVTTDRERGSSGDETLVALDRRTGDERWREADPWSLVAATDRRVVTARPTDDPAVRGLDATTGHEAWRHENLTWELGTLDGCIVHHDGYVYVAADDGLYVLDPTTGRRSLVEVRHSKWRRLLVTDGYLCAVWESEALGEPPNAGCYALSDPSSPAPVGGDAPGIVPEAAADGLLFEGGGPANHEFAAADPERGAVWRHGYQRGITSLAAVTDRTAYVMTAAERTLVAGEDRPALPTFAVDRASGDIRWSFVHAGTAWLGPGMAYLRDGDTVHALDEAGGDVLGSVPAPESDSVAARDTTLRRVGTGLLWGPGDDLRLYDPTDGGGSGTRVFGDGPAHCPACGVDLGDRRATNFCPDCGTEL
jgi:outer membrane protein assembly factor BamB